MTQLEMQRTLSADQVRLIREYLPRSFAVRDVRAPWLWIQLVNGNCDPGDYRIAELATEAGTDKETVEALLAGWRLLRNAGYEDASDPIGRLESIGVPRTPAPDNEPGWEERAKRALMRSAYDAAIRDIEAFRGTHQLQNGFYRQVADAVFDTCYAALEHSEAWKEQHGTTKQATLEDLRGVKGQAANTLAPRVHVISAPMGAGKTTFTTAFIMAMVRVSVDHPWMPSGAAFLVDQIVKADGMYRELNKHLPGKVAIWTSDHDADCSEPKQVSEPAARFRKDDLRDYPVIIITHALFQADAGEKTRTFVQYEKPLHRALTLVDEQMQEVKVYDVQVSVAENIRERVQEAGDQNVAFHLDALLKFMMGKAFSTGSLEKPANDAVGWKVAHELELSWFTTDDARRYAAANRERWPRIDEVFGFARCLVMDYAFIARGNRGQADTHFLGYEPKHAIVPGMVLMDATADIDGVSRLCQWRQHAEVPRGRYDQLSVVHVESQAEDTNLRKYLSSPSNRRSYAEWMKQVVQEQMDLGQKGLVVCKKALLDHKCIPGPFPKNPASIPSADDPPYRWDVEGRMVGVTYWGGPGLGSNAWQDADVVFLFEDYFLPLRAAIASTQGHLMAPTTEGVIATMDGLNSASTEVDWIGQGHILRWVRQMALRGRGRAFDEHGVCGEQKVVISGGRGSLERLVLHMSQLFPGAKLTISRNRDLSRYGHRERLLVALSDPTLPHDLPAGRVGELMGVDWRDIAGHIMKRDAKRMLEAIGWTYVPVKGRGGSLFRRGATNRG